MTKSQLSQVSSTAEQPWFPCPQKQLQSAVYLNLMDRYRNDAAFKTPVVAYNPAT
jgi:hypothetical protein